MTNKTKYHFKKHLDHIAYSYDNKLKCVDER